VPVGRALELAEHPEREALHACAQQGLGRRGAAANELPVLGAWVAEVDEDLAGRLGVERELAVLEVPDRGVLEVGQHRVGRDLFVLGVVEPHRGHVGAQARGILLHGERDGLDLVGHALGRQALGHAEVEEGHPAVGHQLVVAGMRVSREVAVAVERPEEEAEDDLAEAVAGGVVHLADPFEAHAVDPLADEDLLGRQRRHNVGDIDEGVSFPRAREGTLALGLVLVVELVGQALAQFGGHRLGVHARGDALGHAHDESQVLQVRPDGRGDAGVLDLDRHLAAAFALIGISQPRAVDLPDRGGGHRLLLELGEDLLQRSVQL